MIARQIRDKLPVSVCFDDLVSAGTVGLIAAVDKYDSGRRAKLRTYAEHKIRGAILDSLRSLDWAPRAQRRRGRLVESTIIALEAKLQRSPIEDEIAEQLNVPLVRYQEWLPTYRTLSLGSLEEIRGENEGRGLLRYLADSGDLPSRLVERAELTRLLAAVIEKLPELEKSVLSFYYFEERTFREIAGILHLHESRISQLKAQSILRIRSMLRRQ